VNAPEAGGQERSLPAKLALLDIERADPLLGRVISLLSSRMPGSGMFLVGGYLRDLFLGEVSADVDFITFGDPFRVSGLVAEELGGKSFALLEEERTYRVVWEGGRERRTLDFSPVKGFSVEADLSRRDFTINAMAVDVERLARRGELLLPQDLLDKFYGWRDLSRGILRECHKESFLADPVRLLRAMRLRWSLGLEFEERTLNHLKKYAPLITRVPGERVTVELMEILLQPGSWRVFAEMESTGLLHHVFPELRGTVGLEQNAYHHLDVWSHTLLTLEELDRLLGDPGSVYPEHGGEISEHMQETVQDRYPRSAFLRLAALYHDAGKPHTFSRDEGGRIHFHSHQSLSREAVQRLSERLRLSRRAADYLVRVVGLHMDIGFALRQDLTRRGLHRLVNRLGEEMADVVLLSTADRFATRGPLTTTEGLERYVAFCRSLLDEHYRERETPPLLRGGDLLSELGLEEGPLVGEILREVRAAQMEGYVGSREEALELARRLLSSGRASGGPVPGKEMRDP